jgi:hypothetical protein
MEKHCGRLDRVGDLTGGQIVTRVEEDQYGRKTATGSFRVATEIDVLQIGNSTLKKCRVEGNLFPFLEPGREACLYIFRHFHYVPCILGIKYKDDGSKHLASSKWIRGTMLQYIVVWPLMAGIGGAIAGGILFGIIGYGEIGGGLGLLGGVGYAWWSAVRLWQQYGQAKAD